MMTEKSNQIDVDILMKEVKDALQRGYSVGYTEGFSKGRNPKTIDTNNFTYIIENHLEQIKEKYANLP